MGRYNLFQQIQIRKAKQEEGRRFRLFLLFQIAQLVALFGLLVGGIFFVLFGLKIIPL